MVEAQLPMMIAVKDVRYLEQIRGTVIAVQRVRIVDSEGRYFWFAYEMKRVEDT